MLNRENYIPATSTKEMARRLMEMKQDVREPLKTLALREDHITFGLVSLKNDLSATYLKFKVINNSSIIYNLDFVGFENVAFYRKALFSKKKTNKTAVDPLLSVDVKDITPYTTTYFYYAIPIYAVGKGGKLLVTLREKNGVRTLPLTISSKVLSKADLY